jgi:hypothetical protein
MSMTKDRIESNKARIDELREWIADADTLGIPSHEVAELEAEAHQLEDELEDWAQWQADTAHIRQYEPDYLDQHSCWD